MDYQQYYAAAAALPFIVLWLLARRRAVGAERRAESLAAELRDLKERPEKWEGRIERHELLWFPVVTGDPRQRAVTGVAAGVPHCRACVKAMGIQGKEWICDGCGQRRPESVADVVILDGITKEASAQFLQRRPGWSARPL